jgi:hypothetical protein
MNRGKSNALSYLVVAAWLVYFGVAVFARDYVLLVVVALGVVVFGMTGIRYLSGVGDRSELLAGVLFLLSGIFLYHFPHLGWIWILVAFTLAMVLVPLYLSATRRL